MLADLRFAFRSLARSPGFVVVAVLALGVGLGLSTTMFAVLDAVVNPFMPYRDPDTLFRVRWWYSRTRTTIQMGDMYRAIRDHTRSFTVVPVAGARLVLETRDDSRDVYVARVTPRFFEMTGVRPRLGRAFVAGDGEDVAVLGNELWRRLFPRRASLAGATVTLGDRTYAVVGVMPRGAIAPEGASAWLPMHASADPTIGAGAMPMVRLRPGVTRAQADAELKILGATMTAQFTSRANPVSFELAPVRERREELKDIHRAMVGAALGVLIIACVNLAHLMLARGLAKRRELAVRMALGASRVVVVRQMFAECAVVTTGGAVLGALGAVWGADVLTNRMPPSVSWIGLVQPQLSWRVFAVSALAAAASAVLFGLLPAIRVALAVSLDEALKDGAGTTGRSRQRYSPLVVAEVALALVLMMGGGLLLRTVQQLRGVQFTFDDRTLLRAMVGLRRDADTTRLMRRDQVIAAVRSAPGVRDAAFAEWRRAVGGAMTAEMVGGDPTRTLTAQSVSVVSWQYLRVHGLPIVSGRDFEPGDGDGDGVAILNPVAAARLYPRQGAVGRMIKLGAPAASAPWIRIIGVARSPMAIRGEEADTVGAMVWVVGGDRPVTFGSLLIRTTSENPRAAVEVRRKLRALPGMSWSSVEPYAFYRNAELASRGFLAQVFVSMGGVALALAALGLYGVLAYAVNQRMREFAVRIALGAAPRQVFRMVLHDGMVMLLAGIGLGAFAAFATGRLLDAVLTTILPSDVVSLVACEAVLVAVGLLAALTPARRAVRADPLEILRAV